MFTRRHVCQISFLIKAVHGVADQHLGLIDWKHVEIHENPPRRVISHARFLDLADSPFSAINFFAVSDAINSHNCCRIGNLIDDAVVAHPNPPIVLRARKFATSGWTRIVRETTQHISHPGSYAERESP
jgi:hypothetical protein